MNLEMIYFQTAQNNFIILENVANKGSTVLMSTHNYPLIKNRDKRFIELNNGKLIK